MQPIDILEIEGEIKTKLNGFAIESYTKIYDDRKLSNSDWTRGIMEILGTMGESSGCKVCTSGFQDRFENGWLYDLVWYREDENGLTDIPLIVESEWNFGKKHIKYDFEKLMVGRAMLRIMIFQCNYQNQANEAIEMFKKLISGFRMSQTGDRYLFAPLVEETGKFEFESFTNL